MDQPSALHLEIAAAFTPLSNQSFVSTLVFNRETSVGIDFARIAPVDLGTRISQGLPGISVKMTESGIEIDLSALNSRVELREAGLQIAKILEASGSTTTHIDKIPDTSVKKFDQRDREFLDNVPPHHEV